MSFEQCPKWKEQALQVLPELKEEIEEAENPYSMWISIRLAFDNAYGKQRNESLIRRIYGYAKWCYQQPRGETAEDDLLTCVAVCFYEHIPENPAALSDMPRWFTKEDVIGMREILSYHVGEKGFQEMLRAFKKKSRS
jgi:hypothetical protein